MTLSETEAVFAEAIPREFAYLVDEFSFSAETPTINGQGITLSHVHRKLRIANYLEASRDYSTFLIPLRRGKAAALFDNELDEPITFFQADELIGQDDSPDGANTATLVRLTDPRNLEEVVRLRAALLRPYVGDFLSAGDKFLDQVRQRIRDSRLRRLVPGWVEFVESVERGYDGGIAGYVAGVNTRGQIRSLLKVPGEIDPILVLRLKDADARFDRATVPMRNARHQTVMPHPRALRWWRLPENPTGRLRDHFFPNLRP